MANLDENRTTIVDLLSNSLALRQLCPYIAVSSLLALSATSKALRGLICDQVEPWRHLELTMIRFPVIDSSPIDPGGMSWRAERMDEALTEDEFYSGPLRWKFNKLHEKHLLKNVQTLILDTLSVPADLVREIIAEDRYNVKILSIREANNLNQSKLRQVLRYSVRPTRQDGTPKLKALYFFGPKDAPRTTTQALQHAQASKNGVTASEGAQIGAEWNQRSSAALSSSLNDDEMKWYGCTGRILKRPQSEWPETIEACRDLIAFDAVLCRGPRHDITKVDSKHYIPPSIATVALGPNGCESCGTCPERPAIFGVNPESDLPLLSPPPTHASTVRAAQYPQTGDDEPPRLILRCEDCLRGRWCERCNRWWCEDCYQEPVSRPQLRTEMQQLELREDMRQNGWESMNFAAGATADSRGGRGPPSIKVGVHRECLDCGRTCIVCKETLIRRCRNCRGEYCIAHDEGCSSYECAWCSRGGRRTRELY